MIALVDTNVLVYCYDGRFPAKRAAAVRLLIERGRRSEIVVPHQALLEFVVAVSRPRRDGPALLSAEEARREVEDLLLAHPVVFPNDDVVRTAIRGAAVYALSWFDAHLWAYAETFGIPELLSEDFQHGRVYGKVRVTNPFV